MARVSKTNPYIARRLAEARANNQGQEEREVAQREPRPNPEERQEQRQVAQTEPRSNTQRQQDIEETETDPELDDGEKENLGSDEDWQVEKKRKGKSPMKKAPKRGKGARGGPMKGVVIGVPRKPATETSPIRGRRFARKSTFSARIASYEQEEMASKSDPKGKGKATLQEPDEFEEDEACNRFKNQRKMHDDRFDDDDVMPGLV